MNQEGRIDAIAALIDNFLKLGRNFQLQPGGVRFLGGLLLNDKHVAVLDVIKAQVQQVATTLRDQQGKVNGVLQPLW